MKFEVVKEEIKVIKPALVNVEISLEAIAFLKPLLGRSNSGKFQNIRNEIYNLYEKIDDLCREKNLPHYYLVSEDTDIIEIEKE